MLSESKIIERRKELLSKLENRTISIEEAKELRDILLKELKEAQKRKDALSVVNIFAILFLLPFILSKE